ncbi:DMT family transporter [Xylophilus sp.]|uniref:DMT family transporter n=1 Tax=Xylophilus sp. TaxID=2653893 RepID=UPI0013B9994B|nr:DMT family transporter [Xylophilus sp.]KAF1049565.1 MAG: hypothetical protein GAK38_00664 [Xylophilus sp.]
MGAYTLPLLAVAIWAVNTVVSKLAAGAIGAAEIAFYRWLLAGVLLTPFLLGPVLRNRAAVRPQLGRIAALGLLGMVIYQSLAYYAAYSTTATHMGIVGSLTPLMVLGLSIGLLGQRPTAGALVGAVVSIAGVLLVVSSGRPASLLDHGVNCGDLLMLLAMLSYAVYGILLKRWHMPQVPRMQLLYLQVVVAVVALLPLFLLSPRTGLTAANLPLVAFAGVMPSIVAVVAWMGAVARLGPGRSAMFFNLIPLLTAVAAWFMAGERLEPYHAVGGGLTVAGVLLAELWTRPLGQRRAAAG